MYYIVKRSYDDMIQEWFTAVKAESGRILCWWVVGAVGHLTKRCAVGVVRQYSISV